jgi:hypothetical protein
VLRDMREAFQDAEPAEVRELLAPLVSKVELHFDHERHGKLERNPFKHGTIFSVAQNLNYPCCAAAHDRKARVKMVAGLVAGDTGTYSGMQGCRLARGLPSLPAAVRSGTAAMVKAAALDAEG